MQAVISFFLNIFLPIIMASGSAPEPTLVRWPYVQQVDASAALLIWATDQPGASEICFGETPSCEGRLPAVSTRVGDAYHHVAHLTGLLAQKVYTYAAWTGGVAMTPVGVLSFGAGTAGGNLTFGVLGDSRGQDANAAAVRQGLAGGMGLAGLDLVLHAGDASSAGTVADYDAEVFAPFRSLLGRAAFYPALGVHDRAVDPPQPFTDLFYTPRNGPPDLSGRAYAFDRGNAHFVVLDSTAPYQPGSSQYTWLLDDLAGTTQLWKIVVLHHPPYSSGAGGGDAAAREALVPLFEKMGVDLVFTGYDHLYARTYPLLGGHPAAAGLRGVVYVVTGGGGEPLDLPTPSSAAGFRAYHEPWAVAATAGDQIAATRSAHHFVRVQVRGCAMQAEAIDLDGLPIDAFSLDKCPFAWSQVNDGGFGEHPGLPYVGQEVFDLAVHRDQLYVGMEGQACARIWRTRAGVVAPAGQADWEQVVADGFDGGQDCAIQPPATDNDHIDSLEPFNGYLYASTAMQTGEKRGSQVWRSATGDAGDWQQVNRPGFGIHTNENFKDLVAFQGLLCGGTANAGALLDPDDPSGAYIIAPGAQVWCTDGATPDPADPARLLWTQHNKNGFGDPDNIKIWSSAVFDAALYVGVQGWHPAPAPNGIDRAGSVWRTRDIRNAGAWERVFTPADAGLGDEVKYVGVLDAFDGYLYVGFNRPGYGTQIWRSASGDRGAWAPVVTHGFGDVTTTSVTSQGALVLDGALYVALIDRTYGVSVWRTGDGLGWARLNGSGFGDAGTFAADLISFNDSLYAWAANYRTGQQVWRGQYRQ